jgi:hypothetical protein
MRSHSARNSGLSVMSFLSRFARRRTLLAATRGIPDPPPADVAVLATFLPLAAPTLVQTAAAAKALIRALANYADVVTAERATINVLADTIRFLLQR